MQHVRRDDVAPDDQPARKGRRRCAHAPGSLVSGRRGAGGWSSRAGDRSRDAAELFSAVSGLYGRGQRIGACMYDKTACCCRYSYWEDGLLVRHLKVLDHERKLAEFLAHFLCRLSNLYCDVMHPSTKSCISHFLPIPDPQIFCLVGSLWSLLAKHHSTWPALCPQCRSPESVRHFMALL